MQKIQTSDVYRKSVAESIEAQRVYKANELVTHGEQNKQGLVVVRPADSFAAARKYATTDHRIAVLNMASGTSPGGYVLGGANAQEEALCRQSTLYPCLNSDIPRRDYYNFHKSLNSTAYSGAVIYTPNVTVIDRDPDEEFQVDVVSAAAPNLHRKSSRYGDDRSTANLTEAESADIIVARTAKILNICAMHGVDTVVYGAWGCGAYANNNRLVASGFRRLLFDDGYAKMFDTVCFAVLQSHRADDNFAVFKSFLC
jgi:uncharacterized protein (TIGR02452 family)